MEAQILHGLNLALDWFNTLPLHWWYTIGVVVASIPITTLIVQGIKKLHLKYTSTEMTDHLIVFVVTVTGTLMTVSDFILTNSNNLQYLPPFLLVVAPTIKALAPDVFTYSKAINSWFVNRKSETQQERVANTLKLANSFGTEANGATVPATAETPTLPTRQQPETNLVQL